MAIRPKAVIESRNGEKFSPITIAKNVLTDDGQNLHDILSDRKEDMMTPTIVNSNSMFKVGQGDNADYSENVIDGAYESCVLKGQTLVNLATKTRAMGSTAQFNKDTITLTTNTNQSWFSTTLKTVGMKAGGTYLLYTDSITYDDSLSSSPNLKAIVALYEMKPNRNVGRFISNGAVKVTIPSDVDASDIGIRIHATLDEGTGGVGKTTTVKGLMIIEYQEGMENWDIPYFDGICDVKMPILRNVGKNLFDGILESGRIDVTTGENQTNSNMVRSRNFVEVKPSTTYTLSYEIDNGLINVAFYGSNKEFLGINLTESSQVIGGSLGRYKKILTTNNTHYLRFYSNSALTITDTSFKSQLEETSTPTLYEDHKTNILRTSEEIVLRSLPNGVCDTLNVETGEYVQRIGELVVNGDNTVSYTAISTGAEKTIRVAIAHSSIKIVSNESVICAYCNNLGYKYNYQDDKDFESFFVANSNNRIFMRLAKSKLETLDIAGVKKYFSKNPYIFQYELAKPIVSTIDVQGFPYAYKNGHVQLSSDSIEQSLTPKVEYSVVTNRSGQIRSNQKMVERHQKQLDRLQAMVLTNLVNTQYEQTLTNLKYDLKNVREEVK